MIGSNISRKQVKYSCRTLVGTLVGAIALLMTPGVFAQEEKYPDAALLEFLVNWETTEGEWLNPLEFLNIDDAQLGGQSAENISTEKISTEVKHDD